MTAKEGLNKKELTKMAKLINRQRDYYFKSLGYVHKSELPKMLPSEDDLANAIWKVFIENQDKNEIQKTPLISSSIHELMKEKIR